MFGEAVLTKQRVRRRLHESFRGAGVNLSLLDRIEYSIRLKKIHLNRLKRDSLIYLLIFLIRAN